MPVALRVECDIDGCGRHFVVAPQGGDFEDLHASSGSLLWFEGGVSLPEGWEAEGGLFGDPLHVVCAEHAPIE